MSGRGRNRNNRNRNNHHQQQQTLSSVARNTAISLAPDSPVLAMFKEAALKLNEKQDRHERLVKLSRDITIESKRIIFLLHSNITKESQSKTLEEAKERIRVLIKGPLRAIALELEDSPAYLHSRAVTAGLQEYIEARTLCSLMEKQEIITQPEVQKELTYEIQSDDGARVVTTTTLLSYSDYMLGIADLTGELMRKAINSISSGDSEECFFACQVVRELYAGFLGLFNYNKELGRKLSTSRANVAKVEAAVYALRVRGGEAPPTLLLHSHPHSHPHPHWDNNSHSDDEGFY